MFLFILFHISGSHKFPDRCAARGDAQQILQPSPLQLYQCRQKQKNQQSSEPIRSSMRKLRLSVMRPSDFLHEAVWQNIRPECRSDHRHRIQPKTRHRLPTEAIWKAGRGTRSMYWGYTAFSSYDQSAFNQSLAFMVTPPFSKQALRSAAAALPISRAASWP